MREIPQYLRQLGINSMPVNQLSTAGAQQTQRASQELGDLALGIEQQSAKVERMRAQATMRENMHRISLESGANPAVLQQSLDGFRKEFIPNLPAGMQGEFDAMYRMESLAHIDSATNKFNQNLKEDMTFEGLRNFSAATNNLQTAVKLHETAQAPEQRQSAAQLMANSMAGIQEIADSVDADGMYIYSPQQRMAMLTEAIASPIKALSPKAQLMALNPPMGFESNLGLIHEHEIDPNNPDLVHPDGKGLAYRGINSVANPKEFAKIQALLNSGNNLEARAYADEIYKTKYWDAHNLDSMPANVQGIIFDAAVNQGGKLADELVKMVKDGATPSQLLERRQEHYDSLKGKTPQERRSWERRLSTYTPLALGENADLLDPDMREQLAKGVTQALERENQMKMNDYGAWAVANGKDVSTRVAEQAGRPFVQVVPNDEAKQIITSLKNYQTSDDFINFANQFRQRYAGGERFAVQNLVQQGLEPEMEVALQMSTENPNAYKEHIDSLFVYKQLGKEVDNNLKAAGFKPSAVDDAVSSAFMESDQAQIMQYKYGNTATAVKARALASFQAMAKGALLKNPNMSESKAAEFAMKPFADEYRIGKVDGNLFEMPLVDEPESLQRRMGEFYKKKIQPMKKNKLIIDTDEVVPVLNEREDGYRFVTITGEPIPDLYVSIQELHDNYEPIPNAFEERFKQTSTTGTRSTLNPAITKRGKQ